MISWIFHPSAIFLLVILLLRTRTRKKPFWPFVHQWHTFPSTKKGHSYSTAFQVFLKAFKNSGLSSVLIVRNALVMRDPFHENQAKKLYQMSTLTHGSWHYGNFLKEKEVTALAFPAFSSVGRHLQCHNMSSLVPKCKKILAERYQGRGGL